MAPRARAAGGRRTPAAATRGCGRGWPPTAAQRPRSATACRPRLLAPRAVVDDELATRPGQAVDNRGRRGHARQPVDIGEAGQGRVASGGPGAGDDDQRDSERGQLVEGLLAARCGVRDRCRQGGVGSGRRVARNQICVTEARAGCAADQWTCTVPPSLRRTRTRGAVARPLRPGRTPATPRQLTPSKDGRSPAPASRRRRRRRRRAQRPPALLPRRAAIRTHVAARPSGLPPPRPRRP